MNDSSSASKPGTRAGGLITRAVAWRPLRYLFVGGVSFTVDFGLLWLLHEVFGVLVWLAAGIAFLASFVVNYTLQRSVSFSSNAAHGPSLVKYVLLVAANTVVTSVLVQLFASIGVGWAIGKVVTTVITSVANYFVYKLWIFPSDGPPRHNAPNTPGADTQSA